MLADINKRASIEQIYPIGAFAVDAAQNAKQPANELIKGVRILSAPDENGEFAITRGTKHVGEVHGNAFLAAYRTLCGLHVFAALHQSLGSDSRAVPTSRMGQPYALMNPDPRHEYESFINAIIVAAPQVGFRRSASPGTDDPRLRGPRQ